jgi:hypothetical protein
MFNVAILLIGSTIILGTMTVEKDIKSLAHEMESRLGPSGSFEDDLERRKRAVLTALCDAVLTTSANFTVTGSDDGADRVFRRPMLNEILTDYFKDDAEKDKFLAAVRKQFPEDDSVGEGPKRMRVTLRDDHDETFEADIVVSDASTDKDGKVSKYMVGMHIRGEFRARTLEDARQKAARERSGGRHAGSDQHDQKRVPGDLGAEERAHNLYDELSQELLCSFEACLRPPTQNGTIYTVTGVGGSETRADSCDAEPGAEPGADVPRFHLRRATCEVFRRRTPLLASRSGDRHVDLRRLSLPEPMSGFT